MHLVTRLVALLLACASPALSASAQAGVEPALPEGVWPLQPRPGVVEGFDPPSSPWGAGHRGVDLRGRPGQVVRAAAAGTVTFAGTLAGRGVVTVDHGGVRTTYEPVAPIVSAGDRVEPGQPLGTLGLALGHCFPAACLHWGLIDGGDYLDPLLLVGSGPVRLLPLDGSGAGMRLLVGLAQSVGGDVGVDLGRRQ